MFKRMLIANRGEIAVRLIRACHELGNTAVAITSEADVDALHTRLADEVVLIGPPPPAESYLRGDRLIEAAKVSRCEAIYPGYGFLSEAPEFAGAVRAAGLTFIGPPEEAIRAVGVEVQRAPEGQFNLLIDGQRVHAYTAATRTPQLHTELRYVALVDRETSFYNLEKINGSGRRLNEGRVASGTLLAQMPGQSARGTSSRRRYDSTVGGDENGNSRDGTTGRNGCPSACRNG